MPELRLIGEQDIKQYVPQIEEVLKNLMTFKEITKDTIQIVMHSCLLGIEYENLHFLSIGKQLDKLMITNFTSP